MAENKVIAGYLEGERVKEGNGILFVGTDAVAKWTIEEYEVVSDEKSVSLSSGIIRGIAGRLLLGPWGTLAALTAKKKGVYVVALKWKSGNKSLLEIDEKLYKCLVKNLF